MKQMYCSSICEKSISPGFSMPSLASPYRAVLITFDFRSRIIAILVFLLRHQQQNMFKTCLFVCFSRSWSRVLKKWKIWSDACEIRYLQVCVIGSQRWAFFLFFDVEANDSKHSVYAVFVRFKTPSIPSRGCNKFALSYLHLIHHCLTNKWKVKNVSQLTTMVCLCMLVIILELSICTGWFWQLITLDRFGKPTTVLIVKQNERDGAVEIT